MQTTQSAAACGGGIRFASRQYRGAGVCPDLQGTNSVQITFRPADKTNRRAFKALTTEKGQRDFIYSNTVCLFQARHEPECRAEAVFDGETLIGFVFYGKKRRERANRLWVYSLMIGSQFQGRGYGKAVFGSLVKRIYSFYGAVPLYLSVNPRNTAAIHIYEKRGFVRTGETNRFGELIMTLGKQDPAGSGGTSAVPADAETE